LQWTPLFARVWYPDAWSKGEIPTEPVASAQTGGSGVVMPIAWATSTTFSGPTSRISRANTAFTESAVAS